MELIIKTYGKFILEILALIGVLVLLFWGIRDEQGNQGFFRMLGAKVPEEKVVQGEDFAGYMEESRKSYPDICYIPEGALHIGGYRIDELVTATDCEGQTIMVQVEQMECTQGNIEAVSYDAATGEVVFEEQGIYIFKVCATDAWARKRVCEIHIPVNG